MTTRDRGGRAARGRPLRAASRLLERLAGRSGCSRVGLPDIRPPRSRRGGVGRGSPGRCHGVGGERRLHPRLRDLGDSRRDHAGSLVCSRNQCRRRAVKRPETRASGRAPGRYSTSPITWCTSSPACSHARRKSSMCLRVMNAAASGSRAAHLLDDPLVEGERRPGHPLVADEPPHRRQQQRAERPAGEQQRGVAAISAIITWNSSSRRLQVSGWQSTSPAPRDAARGVRSPRRPPAPWRAASAPGRARAAPRAGRRT